MSARGWVQFLMILAGALELGGVLLAAYELSEEGRAIRRYVRGLSGSLRLSGFAKGSSYVTAKFSLASLHPGAERDLERRIAAVERARNQDARILKQLVEDIQTLRKGVEEEREAAVKKIESLIIPSKATRERRRTAVWALVLGLALGAGSNVWSLYLP